jgi:hypothetical protein
MFLRLEVDHNSEGFVKKSFGEQWRRFVLMFSSKSTKHPKSSAKIDMVENSI